MIKTIKLLFVIFVCSLCECILYTYSFFIFFLLFAHFHFAIPFVRLFLYEIRHQIGTIIIYTHLKINKTICVLLKTFWHFFTRNYWNNCMFSFRSAFSVRLIGRKKKWKMYVKEPQSFTECQEYSMAYHFDMLMHFTVQHTT